MRVINLLKLRDATLRYVKIRYDQIAPLGFEHVTTDPETDVLPLDNHASWSYFK